MRGLVKQGVHLLQLTGDGSRGYFKDAGGCERGVDGERMALEIVNETGYYSGGRVERDAGEGPEAG